MSTATYLTADDYLSALDRLLVEIRWGSEPQEHDPYYDDPEPLREDAVTVYRVEHPTGIGPYSSTSYRANITSAERSATWDALHMIDSADEEHPPPHADGDFPVDMDVNRTPERVCGFASEDAMRAWFHSGSLELLLSWGGFQVKRYRVNPEHVWVLDHQVVFDRNHAERVYDHD